MKIEQVMTTEVSTCGQDDTLNDAARIMWERDCGFVPICQHDGRPRVVGIVTDRDLCMAAYTRGQSLREIRIGDVMSTRIRACRPSDSLAKAEATMRDAQIHRLVVVDDSDRLLGVVSLADLARQLAREGRTSRREVTPSEIGETLAAIRQPRQVSATAAS